MINQVKRNYVKDKGLIGIVGELTAQEERDRIYINAFCKKFNKKLTEVNCTFENERHELMYFFDDNLGGYSIGGIIESLI